MGIAEHWTELTFSLECLNKGNAKRRFRQAIKYAFGGLCAYCRSARATTLDHIKPRSKGGSNLRSNLVPCCTACNHSKGSELWLSWYERQDFYNEVVKEVIQEWIDNKHYDSENDERTTYTGAEIRTDESTIRSHSDEPSSSGENSSSSTQIEDGTEEWYSECSII